MLSRQCFGPCTSRCRHQRVLLKAANRTTVWLPTVNNTKQYGSADNGRKCHGRDERTASGQNGYGIVLKRKPCRCSGIHLRTTLKQELKNMRASTYPSPSYSLKKLFRGLPPADQETTKLKSMPVSAFNCGIQPAAKFENSRGKPRRLRRYGKMARTMLGSGALLEINTFRATNDGTQGFQSMHR